MTIFEFLGLLFAIMLCLGILFLTFLILIDKR